LIFAEFPLADALGAVAAHSHRLPERLLRKGTVLRQADLDELAAAGRQSIVAARLDAGDVAEDAAATRIAAPLCGPAIRAERASTGRSNLHAEVAGLLRVDAAKVHAVNAVDEAVTLATLPDAAPVRAGAMLATVKIIPFAVPEPVLARAVAAAAAGVLALHPFRPIRAGLVLSALPGLKDSVIASTIAATRARLEGLGGHMLEPLRCPHETPAIAAGLRRLLDQGAELLLVAAASATVDRRDVAPAAIVACGGAIEHFGMPVDPGNLICIGRIGGVPAVVLPGCARSPRRNGIDWVFARLFAGIPVDRLEIARMGAGGLLADAPRPAPRTPARPAAAAPPVAAVVLAAGASSRMAPHHKLLLRDATGKPMIARVVDNILASAARPVVVVLGHRGAELREALAGRPVSFVDNPDFAQGLATSLAAGLRALPAQAQAAVICLGDMPLVPGRVIDRLIALWSPAEGRLIVQPTVQGRAGNPLLWDRSLFAEMAALHGDAGARALLSRHAEQVAELELEDDSVLRDFDTVESLADLPLGLRPAPAG
jgi:molybdenum cofactor cytidylyltransferase